MARALKNANITLVSYVDKAANKTQFFLTKSASKPVFEKTVQLLTKADDPQKLVYGVVYAPDVEDTQGDVMSATEIEKAAHGFMKNLAVAKGDVIDTQHDFNPGVGEVVESYVAPADIEIGDKTIAKGSWVLVTKASDDIWEKIQKGEITGYSMAGTAEAEEIAKSEDAEAQSFFQLVKNFFAGSKIAKGEVTDKFNATKTRNMFWDALYIFEDVFYNEIWKETPDIDRIKAAAADFGELLASIANDSSNDSILKSFTVTKAGKKISSSRLKEIKAAHDALGKVISEVDDEQTDEEEEIDVKKEELQELFKEALAPIEAKVAELEKAANPDPAPEGGEQVEKAATKEEIAELLKAAIAPLTGRIEVVEKARGISKAAGEVDPKEVEKSDNVWAGLF